MATRSSPSDSPAGSRQRLVASASLLFSRQGYEATGVKDIAAGGSAPIGSFYFHFPGGKEELGVEALAYGANGFAALLRRTLQSVEPVEDALVACAELLADGLIRSDWADGCPVATTALEAVVRAPALRDAAAVAFRQWQSIIKRRLLEAGIAPDLADESATSVLALLEGAEMLARVQGDPAPLRHAAATLRVVTRAAINASAALAD